MFRKPKRGKSLGCRAGKVFLDFIPKALSVKWKKIIKGSQSKTLLWKILWGG